MTPNSLPEDLRERFQFTPGLFAFMSRIFNLSVILQKPPISLATAFFKEYDSLVKKGEEYPALKSYKIISSPSYV